MCRLQEDHKIYLPLEACRGKTLAQPSLKSIPLFPKDGKSGMPGE